MPNVNQQLMLVTRDINRLKKSIKTAKRIMRDSKEDSSFREHKRRLLPELKRKLKENEKKRKILLRKKMTKVAKRRRRGSSRRRRTVGGRKTRRG